MKISLFMKEQNFTNNMVWFIIGILLFLPILIKAEESKPWIINPYGIMSMTHYQLEYGSGEEVSDIKDTVKLSENIPIFGAGITGVYDRFSVDASFITTGGISGDISQEGKYPVSNDPESDLRNIGYNRDIHLKRKTWNVSLGYEPFRNNLESVVIFAGYKQAETSYAWVDHEYKNADKKAANLIGEPSKNNLFNTDGWFLGVGYSRDASIFDHKGRFGLNVSYADLDGELETSRNHREFKGGLRSRTRYEKVFSDTKGWSMGVSWAAGLPFLGANWSNWSYSVFFERASYDFEAKSGHFTDTFFSDGYTHKILDLDSYDATETVYSINLSVSYYFGF
jgi:hypothetical protein